MSRSLNKATLIGNLGSDPEIRTTTNGSRVAQFSVATSRRWTSGAGEQQEKTEWHRIVVWESGRAPGGGIFGVVEKYLKKGERVYVEGEIQYRQYEDKDGVTKYATEINAREIILLGGRDGGGDFGGGGGAAPARERSSAGGGKGAGNRGGGGKDYDDFQAPSFGEDDDDLPF